MTCPQVYSDGAYVLGALSPAERSAYQAHLAECDTCAAAVAALAPMPGLLGRVDPAALHRADQEREPGRLAQLLTAVTAQRRRQRVRRWRLAGASLAAAAVATVGVVVWVMPTDPGSDSWPSDSVAMTPVVSSLPVTAEVAVADAPGGTQVWMSCWYGGRHEEPARPYWLVAYGEDGTSEQLASWLVAPGDEITLTGRTRYSHDELARLELQGSGGATLLTYIF
jgi:Putative zinc-finger